MIITIGGFPGSGKSTVSKHLAKTFGFKRYGMGDLRRKMALDRGMTIDELNKIGEKEGWTDKEVDEYQKELGKKEDNFLADGRLSWFFIPHSIKIFLIVDPKVGAERIFKEGRKSEEKCPSIEAVQEDVKNRLESDVKRYRGLYGVNPYDISHYDIVIDTSDMSIEQMDKEVEKAILEFSKKFGK